MHGSHWRELLLVTLLLGLVACAATPVGDSGTTPGTDALVGKSWTLIALSGEAPGPGPAVTLRFEDTGNLGGSDGCNRYHGSYSADDTALHISTDMAATMMACPEAIEGRARAFTAALMGTASYTVTDNRLSLRDGNGVELAGFEAASLDLAGTTWEVVSYNNGRQAVVSLIIGTSINASFGDDGRVTGNAGCNQYFAAYESMDESVTIGQGGTTRRFCAEPEGVMDQEALYLAALHSAATFRIEGDRLTLRRADGATAAVLVRSPAAAPEPTPSPDSKIRFDLDRLDARGLQGPPDGLRALHYEYCIPDRPEAVRAVADIDPTLQVHRGSPGRIGCGAQELLCLGHTHQPGHRAVLENLAALPAVARIDEASFE